jgi:hypothetical protein
MSPFHAKQVLTAVREDGCARPQRLILQTPVRYRTKGLGHWHDGIVENLSHSGILLRGPQQLSEHTLLEMVLEMPEQISGQKNSMRASELYNRWCYCGDVYVGVYIRHVQSRNVDSPDSQS